MQVDLSRRWSQMSYCRFCRGLAQLYLEVLEYFKLNKSIVEMAKMLTTACLKFKTWFKSYKHPKCYLNLFLTLTDT